MAGTLTISTLSDGTNSTSSTNCIQGSAKAWVNFNGTGTVAIRSSYNVSSITDNGTGNYTVNFTNALPNTDYSAIATCDLTVAFASIVVPTASGTTKTTTACTAQFWTASGGADVTQASFAVFSS